VAEDIGGGAGGGGSIESEVEVADKWTEFLLLLDGLLELMVWSSTEDLYSGCCAITMRHRLREKIGKFL
jgi:hypothetical protein